MRYEVAVEGTHLAVADQHARMEPGDSAGNITEARGVVAAIP